MKQGLSTYPAHYIRTQEAPLPANTFFLGASETAPSIAWLYNDERVEFERDDKLSAVFPPFYEGEFEESAFRPAVGFEVGSIITSDSCSTHTCSRYVITPPDLTIWDFPLTIDGASFRALSTAGVETTQHRYSTSSVF